VSFDVSPPVLVEPPPIPAGADFNETPGPDDPAPSPPPLLPSPPMPTPDMPPAVVSEPDREMVPTPEPPAEIVPAPAVLEATTPVAAPEPIQQPQPEPAVRPAAEITPVSPAGDRKGEVVTVPLRMLVRLGDGTPRFEVKSGDALLLKVYGQQMRMTGDQPTPESGLPGITASGQVRFHGPGISGTCEHLSVTSSHGEIVLRGNVQLKCMNGKLCHEM